MAVDKVTKNVICENCDSEYDLKFGKRMVSGTGAPAYCSFCGEELDEDGAEDTDDDHDHDEISDDDY